MMLPSGNDAARALAWGLGAQEGDTDEEAIKLYVADGARLMSARVAMVPVVSVA